MTLFAHHAVEVPDAPAELRRQRIEREAERDIRREGIFAASCEMPLLDEVAAARCRLRAFARGHGSVTQRMAGRFFVRFGDAALEALRLYREGGLLLIAADYDEARRWLLMARVGQVEAFGESA